MTLEIGGRAVNVVSLGEHRDGRPPVVFVHGLGGTWKNWLENLPAAAEHTRAVAIDLPGFGDSEMPAEDISITRYGQCVDAVCEALDLGVVDLVGNSMGGFVAAEIAIAHRERLRRLVLVDAAGLSINDLLRWPTYAIMQLAVAQSRWSWGAQQTMARRRLRHLAFRTIIRHPTKLPLDLVAAQANGPGYPGFIAASEALLSYDFRDRLGEITARTLVVHGEDDMLVPLADAWQFRHAIPNSRLRILRDTGHVAMLERPRTFNRLLEEFLSEP
jgi:pimeloyl-ACP methyl ester carboxylesterase